MQKTNLIMMGWLLLSTLGCTNLYDIRYEHTQWSRTHAAWRNLPDCAKDHCYPLDYRKGWKDGFSDTIKGGNGCPPVVAPSCYWTPGQILDNCDNRRHAYYSGWQDGAAHASRFPDTHTIKVWSSCECPLPACQSCAASNACMIGSCGASCVTPQTVPTAISADMIEGDHTVAPVPAPEVPAAPASPTPAEGAKGQSAEVSPLNTVAGQATLKNVGGFDEGLIDGGYVVNVSSVEQGATVEVDGSIVPQSFDPAMGSGLSPLKAETTTSKPKANEPSSTSGQESVKAGSTIVEASPIKLEQAPSDGTVQIAAEIDLSAE